MEVIANPHTLLDRVEFDFISSCTMYRCDQNADNLPGQSIYFGNSPPCKPFEFLSQKHSNEHKRRHRYMQYAEYCSVAVGITMRYGSDGLGSIPGSVHTGSEAHSVPCPVHTRGSFLGVKRPRPEADHSFPTSVEVKTGGAITPLHPTPSLHCV